MSLYDTQKKDVPESEIPVPPDEFTKDQNTGVIQNVKRMTIDSGRVRIADGAIYITDETGVDRVLIGYLKDGF